MTTTELYDLEVSIYGSGFPRAAYPLMLHSVLTDGTNLYSREQNQFAEYANGDDVVQSIVPLGLINGSNVSFTTPDNYVPGTLMVYFNGVAQVPASQFTETGADSFDVAVAPETGDVPDHLLVSYRKQKSI